MLAEGGGSLSLLSASISEFSELYVFLSESDLLFLNHQVDGAKNCTGWVDIAALAAAIPRSRHWKGCF